MFMCAVYDMSLAKASHCFHLCTSSRCNYRAGGNGTAGTAMAVPVFEGEKWRRLDSNLTCVIA